MPLSTAMLRALSRARHTRTLTQHALRCFQSNPQGQASAHNGTQQCQQQPNAAEAALTAQSAVTEAVIALGSNMGNRAYTLHWAVQQLNQHGIQVLRCSSLYETAPAYVTNQPAFLNAAVLVRTMLTAPHLLSTLKGLESKAGRDSGGLRWGPRPLDLDIIFYGSGTYQDSALEVPHPRWSERSFVTVPVSDLWYDTDADPSSPPSPSSTASRRSESNGMCSTYHELDVAHTSSSLNGSSKSSSMARDAGADVSSTVNRLDSHSSPDKEREGGCADVVDGGARLAQHSEGSVHAWLGQAVQIVHGAAAALQQRQLAGASHPSHPSCVPPKSLPPPSSPDLPLSTPHATLLPPQSDHASQTPTPACPPSGSVPQPPVTHDHTQPHSPPVHQPQPHASACAAPAFGQAAHADASAVPLSDQTAQAAYGEVDEGNIMRRVMPIGQSGRMMVWGTRTHIMGILNVTPDSFSDGGRLMVDSGAGGGISSKIVMRSNLRGETSSGNVGSSRTLNNSSGMSGRDDRTGGRQGGVRIKPADAWPPVDVELAVQAAQELVDQGADIIDIGGQSTRPGAAAVSVEEELARVLPVIRALKSSSQLGAALISIDTFRAEVARQAVEAGADLVNDVSGGTLDPLMLAQVAALGVPYVLMHMRGDPTTMSRPPHTHYACVWREVGAELQASVDRAVAAGIPAWSIILDPGIGFAKSSEGSLSLIRNLAELRKHYLQGAAHHAPFVVGPSRKRFLTHLTGHAPVDNDVASAAVCVSLIGQGADVVRVHNVGVVKDAVLVADAVYR